MLEESVSVPHVCYRLARYSNPLSAAQLDFSGIANRGCLSLPRLLDRVRIRLSPPASLDRREILPSIPPKYLKYAYLSRLFLSKPDCG
jgi:hypothetical protein